MPFIIAAIGAIAAIYFFVIRARNAQHMATEVLDAANDVRLAARRFGFKRRTNVHPVDSIDDPNIAIAALGSAFVELDDLPTADQRQALSRALARSANVPHAEAEEMLVLGRWIMNECGSPAQAVPRIGRKLYKMSGADAFQPLLEVVQATAQAGRSGLSQKQKEALADVQNAFRIS
ncbi:hypothetical protein [Tropicibacter alexandrii]|uniref:hypothetical protein n=1 Tax=Tropicibacter alexandrii TaxID=2267683 RepID=UPI001008FAC2|nr:hypothetical protein [Tropicibacter alexandrii]